MKIAKEKAKAELDKLLYSALEWPTNRDGYLKYLTQFSRWIPRQSTNPAWTDPGTDEQQEVYDRLCHFYFLVDQQLPDGRIVENDEWFSNWLVEYADLWGSFLNTTDSFRHYNPVRRTDSAPFFLCVGSAKPHRRQPKR